MSTSFSRLAVFVVPLLEKAKLKQSLTYKLTSRGFHRQKSTKQNRAQNTHLSRPLEGAEGKHPSPQSSPGFQPEALASQSTKRGPGMPRGAGPGAELQGTVRGGRLGGERGGRRRAGTAAGGGGLSRQGTPRLAGRGLNSARPVSRRVCPRQNGQN